MREKISFEKTNKVVKCFTDCFINLQYFKYLIGFIFFEKMKKKLESIFDLWNRSIIP